MDVDYRQLAKEALARAKEEMASGDPIRFRYAALELRDTMEAITYSRAASYRNQLPEELYNTWQPRELVKYLAEIDARGSFSTSTLSIGVEDELGKPAKTMRLLGTETRLTMKDLKAQYDALGFFLHMPTIAQMRKNKLADAESLKRRCEKCMSILEPVLKSPIWNSNIGQFVQIQCQRCETDFGWQYNADAAEPLRAQCVKCGAVHLLYREGDKFRIEGERQAVACPTTDCKCEIGIWRDEMQPGRWWKCNDCSKVFGLTLAVQELSPEQITQLAT